MTTTLNVNQFRLISNIFRQNNTSKWIFVIIVSGNSSRIYNAQFKFYSAKKCCFSSKHEQLFYTILRRRNWILHWQFNASFEFCTSFFSVLLLRQSKSRFSFFIRNLWKILHEAWFFQRQLNNCRVYAVVWGRRAVWNKKPSFFSIGTWLCHVSVYKNVGFYCKSLDIPNPNMFC